MRVRLGQELDAASLVELLQEFDDLGSVVFKLFDGTARKREGTLEIVGIGLGHFNECFDGRHVGTFGCFGDGACVLVVIVVVVVSADVEETVTLQVDILVYLEIKTNCFHDELGF